MLISAYMRLRRRFSSAMAFISEIRLALSGGDEDGDGDLLSQQPVNVVFSDALYDTPRLAK